MEGIALLPINKVKNNFYPFLSSILGLSLRLNCPALLCEGPNTWSPHHYCHLHIPLGVSCVFH